MTSPNIHIASKVLRPEDITVDDLRHLSNESLPIWAMTSGLKADGFSIDFEKHRYLLPIYLDPSRKIVWQKAAQLGATVYILSSLVHWLYTHQGRKGCLYFPTKEGVENLSKTRLGPMLHSIESFKGMVSDEDKLGLKKIGESDLFVLHIGGTASRDSNPFSAIYFDELRLMSVSDVEQCRERISHSEDKIEKYFSTCGLPGTTINARYELGKQYVWHSKCFCSDGVDLARAFPDCVVEDTKRNKLYLRCPKCKATVVDAQNGRYVPMNPGADYPSYHVSQLASKYISLKEIWDVYKTGFNREEFVNAKLGLPYIDENARGVTMADLRSCIDPGLSWDKPDETERCVMGVDQGAGYNMAVIMSITPEGKRRIRHVEIIEINNPRYYINGKPPTSPFDRLAELMSEFNIQLAVCDAMPNYNNSLSFAMQFQRRVFLSFYNKSSRDVVTWADKAKTPLNIAKSGPLFKFKYKAIINRYLSLDSMLNMWRSGDIIMPDPAGLAQMCRSEKSGALQPESPMERLMDHLCRLIRRETIIDEDTGETKYDYIYTGGDPHLAHACNYAIVGSSRLARAFGWSFE